MYEPTQILADNFRTLAQERGTTLPAMAGEYEAHSPGLAAWMRRQAAEGNPDAATAAPVGRAADPGLVTTEAVPAETAAPEPAPAEPAPEPVPAQPKRRGRPAAKPKE